MKPRDLDAGELHAEPRRRLRVVVMPFIIFTAIWGSTWIVIRGQLGTVAAAMVGHLPLRHRRASRWPLSRRGRATACVIGRKGLLAALFLGFTQFCVNFNAVYLAERHITSGVVATVFALLLIPATPARLGVPRPAADARASRGARWSRSRASSCCSSMSFASMPPSSAPDRGRHRPDARRHARRGDRQRRSGAARNPPLPAVRAARLVDGRGRGDRRASSPSP